jgi:hypothetical protein
MDPNAKRSQAASCASGNQKTADKIDAIDERTLDIKSEVQEQGRTIRDLVGQVGRIQGRLGMGREAVPGTDPPASR